MARACFPRSTTTSGKAGSKRSISPSARSRWARSVCNSATASSKRWARPLNISCRPRPTALRHTFSRRLALSESFALQGAARVEWTNVKGETDAQGPFDLDFTPASFSGGAVFRPMHGQHHVLRQSVVDANARLT